MARPKEYDLPDYMTWDAANGVYVVRNPLNGKKRSFADEQKARGVAKAVAELVHVERQREALSAGRPTLAGLVKKWIEDKVPLMPWAPGTRENYVAKANRISKELGTRTIVHTDCMFIEDWIAARTRTADAFNDWRYVFVLLWRFAVSRKLAEANEPEKIEERSTSKKLEANRKQRQPLEVQDFKDIHEKAEPWLQLAMEESLVTLQGRSEICNMRLDHHRDGWLYVIRAKVSGDSDMAFIKIAITEQIEEFLRRSRQLDDTASPYMIHRRPDSMRREHLEPKPHWTYVTPDYLSKAFAEARDQVPRFNAIPPRTRPTFHEVRGLGARLYEDSGMAKQSIQRLMTHTDQKVTEIYLEGGTAALKDDDFQAVVAPMRVRDML